MAKVLSAENPMWNNPFINWQILEIYKFKVAEDFHSVFYLILTIILLTFFLFFSANDKILNI